MYDTLLDSITNLLLRQREVHISKSIISEHIVVPSIDNSALPK